MILPGVYNDLILCAGDPFDFPLNWKDADGNLFDLTGFFGDLTFLRSPNSASAIYQITQATGITFSDTEPNIRCVIPDDETTLDAAPHYYILRVGADADSLQRLLDGVIEYRNVVPSVP